MASSHERARMWVAGAIKRARETGEVQASANWGYGQRTRRAAIWVEDGVLTASLVCWGYPERIVIGSEVFCETLLCLAEAG